MSAIEQSDLQDQPSPSHPFETGDELTTALESAWVGIAYWLFFLGGIVPFFYSGVILFGGMSDFPLNVIGAILFLGCGAVAVLVTVLASSAIAVGLVVGFHWSMGDIFSRRVGVVAFGCLSGFVATTIVRISFFSSREPSAIAVAIAATFLAMFVGYLGAIIVTGRRKVWSVESKLGFTSRFQFEIRHILVFMIWFSVLMMLDLLIGDYLLLINLILFGVIFFAILFFDWAFCYGRWKRKSLRARAAI